MTARDGRRILTLNRGSSSLKFAVFEFARPPRRLLIGKFDRIGLSGSSLTVTDLASRHQDQQLVEIPDHVGCAPLLVEVLDKKTGFTSIGAIAHRVVHGGPSYLEPQPVTPEMLQELRRLAPFDPEHLPPEIGLMESFHLQHPGLLQIACFDTAFHRDLPRVAKLLPLPRHYEAKGIWRYGFHGLSYSYLMEELARVAGEKVAHGRVILAHLGNGASMAAVRDGGSIDTTMAFTPSAGLVMSSRSGDLDPGLAAYLARTEGLSPQQFYEMVSRKSGLLGVSETSSDVRDLLKLEGTDVRAREALGLFCYQARKWLGALTTALGGLETLVFSGGIGENSAVIRARICTGLEFLGLELDAAQNEAHAPIITRAGSRVTVRVMRTDEELHMANLVAQYPANPNS